MCNMGTPKKRPLEEGTYTPFPYEDLEKEDTPLPREVRLEMMRQMTKILVDALLTSRQREIFMLYYGKQMTMGEIAKTLGLSKSTVSRTHKRAVERLRQAMARLETPR